MSAPAEERLADAMTAGDTELVGKGRDLAKAQFDTTAKGYHARAIVTEMADRLEALSKFMHEGWNKADALLTSLERSEADNRRLRFAVEQLCYCADPIIAAKVDGPLGGSILELNSAVISARALDQARASEQQEKKG